LQWYNVSTGGSPLSAGTALTTGTYYVSQTVSGCESSRTSVAVTVDPTPVTSISISPSTVCSGSNFTINFSSSVSGTAYNWTRTNNGNLIGMDPTGPGGTFTTDALSAALINIAGIPQTSTFTMLAQGPTGCPAANVSATITV